eukprot:CAMPEP_0183580352 /NCGR_PEP_ID=MMETSP0371-20130417/145531_1 /TAXON_ID=268820 /ORGANISM="Peridinium aciculiferum, Strain PAER-2" /LENGTH=50 /DNA_ID=CAMNT_0025790921 /DNA_START=44 /DNA_END=193 /DNA_ORIENTATION=-
MSSPTNRPAGLLPSKQAKKAAQSSELALVADAAAGLEQRFSACALTSASE